MRAARTALLVVLTALTAAAVVRPERARANAHEVLVVGDSLAVGMEPFLGPMLAGRQITWDARSGRTTPTGLMRLRLDLRRVRPQTVVVSLGTNDGPDPARFASRLRRLMAAVPTDACVFWPSINRPPRKGPYQALNHVLRDEARRYPRLVVVDWNRAVVSRRVFLPDGLHPDPAGFRVRARMISAAIGRGCPYPLSLH
jgi:lysophospholipase L1-like esterase